MTRILTLGLVLAAAVSCASSGSNDADASAPSSDAPTATAIAGDDQQVSQSLLDQLQGRCLNATPQEINHYATVGVNVLEKDTGQTHSVDELAGGVVEATKGQPTDCKSAFAALVTIMEAGG